MKMLRAKFILILFFLIAGGCASSPQKDDASSAIRAVAEGMVVTQKSIKYCPVDGKRFSSQVENCPEHNVPLKFLEE